MTHLKWKRGRSLAWDANTYEASYIQADSTLAGSAKAAAETKKIAKQSDIVAGVDFVPFAVETST